MNITVKITSTHDCLDADDQLCMVSQDSTDTDRPGVPNFVGMFRSPNKAGFKKGDTLRITVVRPLPSEGPPAWETIDA